MISYHIGDALEPINVGKRIIAHIVNNEGKWGKGFVLAISRKYNYLKAWSPETMYKSWYLDFCKVNKKSPLLPLGEVQYVNVEKDVCIANMVAQHTTKWDNNFPPIRYDALSRCLNSIGQAALTTDATIHMPRIGTGLGGGKWEIVEALIKEFIPEEVYVNVYECDKCGVVYSSGELFCDFNQCVTKSDYKYFA